MLDPEDSCLACHRLPTMLSSDLVTMLSAAADTGWPPVAAAGPHLPLTPCGRKRGSALMNAGNHGQRRTGNRGTADGDIGEGGEDLDTREGETCF